MYTLNTNDFMVNFLGFMSEITDDEIISLNKLIQGDTKVKNNININIPLANQGPININEIKKAINIDEIRNSLNAFINAKLEDGLKDILDKLLNEKFVIKMEDFNCLDSKLLIDYFRESIKNEYNGDLNSILYSLGVLMCRLIVNLHYPKIDKIIGDKLTIEKLREIIEVATKDGKVYTYFITLLCYVNNKITIKSLSKEAIAEFYSFSIMANNCFLNYFENYKHNIIGGLIEKSKLVDKLKKDFEDMKKICDETNADNDKEMKFFRKQISDLNKEKARLIKLNEEHAKNYTQLANKINFNVNKDFKDDILKLTSQVKYNTIEKTLTSEIAKANELLLNEKTLNRRYRDNIKELNLEIEKLKKTIKDKDEELNNLTKNIAIDNTAIEEVVACEVVEEKPKCNYGYICFTNNNKLYVHIPNNNNIKIEDLEYDEDQYFIDGQVVKVSGNKLLRTYDFYTDKHLTKLTIAYIMNEDGINKIYDANNKEIQNINTRGFNLYKKHFLAIDNYNTIKFMFRKNLMDNLFMYKKSILSRGHNAYICRDIFGSMYIFKNAFTSEEIAIDESKIDFNNFKITKNSIVILTSDNKVTLVNDDITFYTKSNQYDKKSYVNILKTKDKIYGKNKHGELILLNIDENTVKDGDVLAIDEYNNGLFVTNAKLEPVYEVSKKIKNKTSISDNLDIKESIVIIGNPGYQSNYRLAFLKESINAVFVDGGSFISKVRREVTINEAKAIIFCKNYISHDLMWRIKENYLDTDVKVILADSDGANNIVNLYKEGRNILNGSQFNS